ncbi:MAG TPA: CopD family protein [Methyloceanibacter sp.]|nr:CopD family protein [Methyloceanibacter sp.]
MALLVASHILAAVVWVGGMFLAYVVLRPSAGPLEAETRLALWQRVFRGFFPWVWASIVVLLASGYAMIFLYFGGFAGAGLHIHLMQGIGIVMVLLFGHLFFGPWRRFSQAMEARDFAQAGGRLNQIRLIVAINLTLGLLTIIVGASGRFW